jgi:hypothetical protein
MFYIHDNLTSFSSLFPIFYLGSQGHERMSESSMEMKLGKTMRGENFDVVFDLIFVITKYTRRMLAGFSSWL